ncbi:coproporphyrinogen III oxidase [Rhodobacterales bacterium LSUCC0031]|nr:coproporphyrinogen III oxidase [Rhodobacterales bacterium LSUCC0031]
MREDWEHGGFGLYVHWPFCQAKCPYCDFNSHVARSIDQRHWLECYLIEIKRVSRETHGRTLTSIFFGGGTPSLMDPDITGQIISAAKAAWPSANDLEVTLEANPTSVEAGRFSAFRDSGVNRVSIGLQALRDADLKRLGRLHSAAEGRRAFDLARGIFPRVSFDLIYARQFQSLADWKLELHEAIALAADHLSLYQLTIEPGTAFGDRHALGKLAGLTGEDLGADMYDLTQEMCEAAGLPAYEVSNHARDLAQSRHNLIYWRGGDYAGIGPGAHGRLTLGSQRFATEAERMPQSWLKRVQSSGSGEVVRSALSRREHAEEYAMMALRLNEGLERARFIALNGADFNPLVVEKLAELDLLTITDRRFVVTGQGRRLLNAVLRELLAD